MEENAIEFEYSLVLQFFIHHGRFIYLIISVKKMGMKKIIKILFYFILIFMEMNTVVGK